MATELISAQRAPSAARRMADAASRFVDALTPWQRSLATFPFEGEERYFWHYTPVARNGLLLIDMTPAQQALALALMATGLSERGTRQARQIIALETMLRVEEHIERPGEERWDRNPLRYYFSVFGQPGGREPWAWRVGGHHLSQHRRCQAAVEDPSCRKHAAGHSNLQQKGQDFSRTGPYAEGG